MNKTVSAFLIALSIFSMAKADTQSAGNVPAGDNKFIGPQPQVCQGERITPEVLWAMGRVGGVKPSPDGKKIVYNVTYYSVEQNKSHSVLYVMDLATCRSKMLTTTTESESDAMFVDGGKQILYLRGGQLWIMNSDGSNAHALSSTKQGKDIDGYLLSPDEKHIVVIRQVESTSSIQKNPDDLPLASGMVINDMMYKHWDHFVKTIPHPFVADFNMNGIGQEKDVLEGEPYECPMLPFGGVEQLAWSPDSKTLAYTCRKKTGKAYSMSTDSDIFLYDLLSGATTNICKPQGYTEPVSDDTRSLEDQPVNASVSVDKDGRVTSSPDLSLGYDQTPIFSPNGRYIAWSSMARDGYESDRARLCVYDRQTGKKIYVSEAFQSGVDTYCWAKDSKSLYFSGSWHGTNQIYSTNLNGDVRAITSGDFDHTIEAPLSATNLLVKRHSMSQADEIYILDVKGKAGFNLTQLTHENEPFYQKLQMGEVKERWVKTVDNKQMLCWVVYPPHFDQNKKYATLLFCEGGPQSPVSQGWSFRWNFQLMAANDYIVILPSRRGVPGFGKEWVEEIGGDYNGLCMQDYLSAIDDICREPYVDKDKLGCVGASFGGYSVYWLAGHHQGRFKAFIAHDGIYNLQQQYVETDELWFPNWDLKAAPWRTDVEASRKAYMDSPHLSVDKWDTPILCIHGMKDYRIMFTQAESAFQAAVMRGVPAQMLLMPDENHWVLKPQNGILWQRTFFSWLERWLNHPFNPANVKK